MKRAFLFVLFCTLPVGSGPEAATWNVYPDGSGDAPTIAAAADSAASGDIVYVHAGAYTEEGILFEGKDVTFYTEGLVYINAPVEGSGSCITIRSATGAFNLTSIFVRGFGVGISLEDASPMILYTTIQECGTGMSISGESAPFFGIGIVDSSGTAISVAGGSPVTLRNLTIVGCTTGVSVLGGSVTVEKNIIYGCETGVACAGGEATLTCNDLYANTVNYEGCEAGPTDFFLDPVFCFFTPPSTNPYLLHVDSPCTTANSPCDGFLGFNGIPACSGEGVEDKTWGKIKDLYR